MISISDVSKRYGMGSALFTALDGVSVDIAENEFFTLLGPSGCGKTTLLRVIAGFEQPSSGSVRLNNQDIAHLPPYLRPVNTVFQSYALFPHMTVAGNIAFGLEMQGKPAAEVADTVERMLALVKMTDMRDRLTSQISGGQQQRVALARALAPSPKVLLLDEPLSALDYKLRKEMQIELKRLQHETGITFIFVTHDQEEALTMSDRIAVMSAGHILQVGTPHAIYERPANRFVADFIGETNFLAGQWEASANGGAVRLASGDAVLVATSNHDFQPESGQRLTLAVRPEHAYLAESPTLGSLQGKVVNRLYLGTDTHFHLVLSDGSPFMVRQQNRAANQGVPEMGDTVGIGFNRDAVRILRD